MIDHFKRLSKDRLRLFISHSLSEAKEHAHAILEERHAFLYCVGGDGTIYHKWNILNQVREETKMSQPLPTLALQKGGTGNALASVVGETKAVNQLDKLLFYDDLSRLPTKEVPLIEVSLPSDSARKAHTFFAGTGWDAAVVNGYNEFKQNHSGPWQRWYSHGLLGYLLSVGFHTIPRLVKADHLPRADIICNYGVLYRIGQRDFHESDRVALPPSNNLSEIHPQPINAILAGTVPFFGFKFRAFPYASLAAQQNLMQLRVVVGEPKRTIPHLVLHAGSIWRGTYRGSRIEDYFTNDVTLQYHRPEAFQIAGDAKGCEQTIRYRISGEKMKLVDWRKVDL